MNAYGKIFQVPKLRDNFIFFSIFCVFDKCRVRDQYSSILFAPASLLQENRIGNMTGELRTASTSCLLFLLISIPPRTNGPFIQHGLA